MLSNLSIMFLSMQASISFRTDQVRFARGLTHFLTLFAPACFHSDATQERRLAGSRRGITLRFGVIWSIPQIGKHADAARLDFRRRGKVSTNKVPENPVFRCLVSVG